MKQEHRFVAELYSLLRPFIDPSTPVFLSLDGEAAKKGVRLGLFADSDVPDLWFTIIGNKLPTTLEAKVIGDDRRMKLNNTQLARWRTGGHSAHSPDGWVAVNEELSVFYYWSHFSFLPKLDACQSQVRYPSVGIPGDAVRFSSIAQLAMCVLRSHNQSDSANAT